MIRSGVCDNYDRKNTSVLGVYDTLEIALNALQHSFYLALDRKSILGVKPNRIFFLNSQGWPITYPGYTLYGMRAEFDPPSHINSLSFWIEPVKYIK